MSSQERPGVAFALSLIGGILMLLSGGLTSLWSMGGGFGGMMGGFGGMMGGYQGMMGGLGMPLGFMGGLSLVGLVAGIVVIVGALMLNTRPAEHTSWGPSY